MSTARIPDGTPLGLATCSVLINKVACLEPAAEIWWIGCLHEHVTDNPICAEHAATLRADWDCLMCKRAGGSSLAYVINKEQIPKPSPAAPGTLL